MHGYLLNILEQQQDFVDFHIFHFEGKPLLLETKQQVLDAIRTTFLIFASEYAMEEKVKVKYIIQHSKVSASYESGSITIDVVSLDGNDIDCYSEFCEMFGSEDV